MTDSPKGQPFRAHPNPPVQVAAFFAIFGAGFGVSMGCMPHHLEKYQSTQSYKGNSLTDKNLTGPPDDPVFALAPKDSKEKEGRDKETRPSSLRQNARDRSTSTVFSRQDLQSTGEPTNQESPIYQVDRNTFHFRTTEPEVWESVLDVLMRNYSLSIVDRNSGILTTEWDSFYLGKAVFRNKLTFRVKKAGLARPEANQGVDLTVHNSVEKLSDTAQGALGLGAVWLPAKDPIEEVHRVIQNMAMILRQPPPVKMVDPEVQKSDSSR